MWDDMSEVA